MDSKSLIKDIKAGKFSPVYVLHGDEAYYIDEISDAIQEHALEEHERDFNQSIVYGKEADLLTLISDLRSYPLMSERRLLILKEAQDFKLLEELNTYIENPLSSTVLVICHKYKAIDARKKLLKSAAKVGVIFKSDKVKEYQLVDWTLNMVKAKGFGITSKANMLLVESLGNDLSRIVNEINKLAIFIEPGTTINEVHIEENIGISKDYNIYELANAVAVKDYLKAMKIVNYFDQNLKPGDFIPIYSSLFKFFTQIMRIHFLPNKSQEAVARALQIHPFVANGLLSSKNNYSPKKIAANIELLHIYDLKAKGVGNQSMPAGEIMRELVFQLLH
jgi:DNA polymerase-3 subunit delta